MFFLLVAKLEAPQGWERTAWIAGAAGLGAVVGALLAAYGIHVWKTGAAS